MREDHQTIFNTNLSESMMEIQIEIFSPQSAGR